MNKKFLAIIVLTGIIYGLLSANFNQPHETELTAWGWEPNPVWLPSYLLCKSPTNGIGITKTKSGYIFRSKSDKFIYYLFSTLIGVLLSLSIGFFSRKILNHRI